MNEENVRLTLPLSLQTVALQQSCKALYCLATVLPATSLLCCYLVDVLIFMFYDVKEVGMQKLQGTEWLWKCCVSYSCLRQILNHMNSFSKLPKSKKAGTLLSSPPALKNHWAIQMTWIDTLASMAMNKSKKKVVR